MIYINALSMVLYVLQDFVRNLFELFDTEKRGYISIQEFIGGLRLLMA